MRMGFVWFFLLVFAEIWSIIKVSHHIGAWATLILLVAGFIFGLKLMRSQGINALMKNSQNVQSGESLLAPLAQGIVNAFAGILLIIPGFITDIIALIILLPFVRKKFAAYLAKKGQFQGFGVGGFNKAGFGGAFGANGFGRQGAHDDFIRGNVYEHKGPAERVDEAASSGRILEHEPDKKD